MKLRDEYVHMLETENEELREKVRILEEAIGMRLEAPLIFQLTRHESMMFGVLFGSELVTKQHAMNALYGDRIDENIDDPNLRLRKKLKPFDIEIETVWGQGYRMPAKSKAAAGVLLEQARAA